MVQLLLAVIYLSFISLGLPDSLLGAAWPSMYPQMQVPVSYAGILSMIISIGTVISSLQSDRLTRKLGTGRVTAFSVAMTAIALFGFSISGSYWALCLWAIPYGLGAGSVDASLNNYVALHYASRHMSWLHCMWGLGAAVGPYIMEAALRGGRGWGMGYRTIAFLQLGLTVLLLLSLPLWKRRQKVEAGGEEEEAQSLSLKKILFIPGAKEVMLAFFCYCALEATAMLWSSSYLVLHIGLTPEWAAGYAGLFYIGMTVGRGISGFLTFRLTDTQMIRLGQGILLVGIVALLLPLGEQVAVAGLLLTGLGCAPIYPCIIHSTPDHFGAHRSQAVIGVQMASAYMGTCLMPPLFGLIANHITAALFPVYLLLLLLLMAGMYQRLLRVAAHNRPGTVYGTR